jgi:hypothetical protein
MCGVLNSHEKNDQTLVLTQMNGDVMGYNQASRSFFGEELINDSYSMFLSIPSLLKFYYPAVSSQLKYGDVSGQMRLENRQTISYQEMTDFKAMQKGVNVQEVREDKLFQIEEIQFQSYMFKIFLTVQNKSSDNFQVAKDTSK